MSSGLEARIPPVLLTLLFASFMWLLSLFTPAVPFPDLPKSVAVILTAGAGLVVGVAGVVSFRRARTTVNPLTPEACSSLVVAGVFRLTRNPMYLGLLLALLAWALFLANLYTLILLAGWVAYMNRFQIRPEERALEAAFGEDFLNYKKRVRRWL